MQSPSLLVSILPTVEWLWGTSVERPSFSRTFIFIPLVDSNSSGGPIFFNLLYFHFPLFTLLPPSPLQWRLNLMMYICILQLTQHQTLPIFHKNVDILSCTHLPFDLTTFLEKALAVKTKYYPQIMQACPLESCWVFLFFKWVSILALIPGVAK